MWNKIKYYLGMKSVVRLGDKWFVTRKGWNCLWMQSKEEDYFYSSPEIWYKSCAHDTREEAVTTLEKFKVKF